MAQYIIDIGAVPDDGQGDPLRKAFDYTNQNFNQIFAAGPVLSNIQIGNTTITTTILNSNLILSPSGIGRIQLNNTLFPRLDNVYDIGTPTLRFNSIYLGTGGINSQGGITTTGNITAGYFIGNGSQLTGIVATTGSEVVNGNSNINIPSAGSNIFVSVNGTSNVVSFANTGIYVAGQVSATGNIAGNYILGNGALLTGINIGYGNANVAAYLPTYTGNLVSLTGPVTTTANVTGGNLRTAGQISATGNITGGNVSTGRLNAGYVTVGTTVSAIGNIATSSYFIGDGSLLTGINANYGNSNVAAFLPTYTGNLTSLTGPVTTTANVTGGNLRTSGSILATGNITAANLDTGLVNAANITASGAISAVANITTGAYFIGDGSQLTNLPAGNYSNANVAAYLPIYTGSIPSLTGLLRTTANIVGGNITILGNILSGNVDTGRVIAGNITVSGPISAVGNITGDYILGNGAFLTGINANYSNANVASYLPTYTGNLVSLTGPVTTTANVTGGNLRTLGQISAVGNITGGNVDTGQVNAGNITVSGPISAVGNISTSAYFIGDGSQLTNLPAGNYSNANVAAFLPTYTGNLVSLTGPVTTTANVTGGNLKTTGQISATGNITGGNVDASLVNANTVTVNTTISAGGNITGNNLLATSVIATRVTATANVVGGNVTTAGQVSAAGNIQAGNVNVPGGTVTSYIVSATGKVQGGNLVTTGYITATGNITGGNVDTGNVHAGNVDVDTRISAGGNVIGQYFIGNGSQLTGIVASGGTSINYGNSNVKVVSADGNVSVNINNTSNVALFTPSGEYVSGVISATGNILGNGFLSDHYYYANGTPVPFGITYTAATAPPLYPSVADQWWDTTNSVLYEYLNDGTSNYWVDTTSPAFAGGVVANVAISGTLIPVANVTFDIGTSNVYFRNTYTQNLYTNNRLPAYNMPVGAVVQTVMSSSLGGSTTNSGSYVDVSYANVTITPSSATSKVLVMATGTSSFTALAGQNISADTQLVRSPSTSLQIQTCGVNLGGGSVGTTGAVSYSYMDSPGTTSPVTYKLQQKISNTGSTLTSTNIWLIAMEIAAT
jgi:hypothetical protein